MDAWLNAAQTQYENGHLEDSEVWRAFSTFGMLDEPELEAVFDEWVARHPGSYAARLARGGYLQGAGWRARGGEYAAKTPAHRFARMRTYLDRAHIDLEAATKLSAKPTVALAALIHLTRAEGGLVQGKALLERALVIDPGAQTPRYEFIGSLLPRWGGSHAQMERFAETARASLDGKHAGALAGMIPSDQASELELAIKDDPKGDPKRLEAALALADRAVALAPEHAAFLAQKAGLLALAGRRTEALEWFGRAIALSDAPTHYMHRGIVLAESGRNAEAVSDFLYAAELGDRYAQQHLGWGYRMGAFGLQKDPDEALKWFRRIAVWGDNYAQYMVGDLLREGAGEKLNLGEAVKWYRLAAEDGYAPAQGNLGSMYWNGLGVQSDRWEAVRWWRLAAAQGNDNAKRNLEHLLNPLQKVWVWVLDATEPLLAMLRQWFV